MPDPMTAGLTVTLDLEDHRLGGDPYRRYRDNALRLLDFLAAEQVRATIFVVGDIVDACRELLRRASEAGHEIGLHSTTHTPLTHESSARYPERLAAARARLEQLVGKPVTGFRAPVFSLTPASAWVVDALPAAGFAYSSSILPAPHPLYGYPGAPREPFRWPNGLLELPVPLGRLGPVELPFLGGIYLRYLPLAVIRRLRAQQDAACVRWTYLHPYDIDAAEPYYRFPGTTLAQSVLLWRNRRGTLRRLATLLHEETAIGLPLGERAAHLARSQLPGFAPRATAHQ